MPLYDLGDIDRMEQMESMEQDEEDMGFGPNDSRHGDGPMHESMAEDEDG